jgi:peroxiredoxin
MKSNILFLVVFFCFTATIAVAQPPRIGTVAPEIKLKNQYDSTISLSSFRGKVVLLDFWASWCGPCRVANKHLVKLYAKYKEKGFEIVGISNDYTKSEWVDAIKKDKITWTQVLDEGGLVSNKWYISYLPISFLLDKEGKIVAVELKEKALEEKLKELL